MQDGIDSTNDSEDEAAGISAVTFAEDKTECKESEDITNVRAFHDLKDIVETDDIVGETTKPEIERVSEDVKEEAMEADIKGVKKQAEKEMPAAEAEEVNEEIEGLDAF